MIIDSLKKVIQSLCFFIVRQAEIYQHTMIYSRSNVHSSVRFDNLELIGNVEIREGSYLNRGCTLTTGDSSRIVIGKFCAIGRYVHISSKTHDLTCPTPNEEFAVGPHIESSVEIGNYVWIGDKVFVRPGVKIGDYAVIGANSVVLDDVARFEIVGGLPAKHIRFNEEHIHYSKDAAV